jgi:hypothetical protein
MWCGSRLDKFASALVVLSVGVLVSGTKACQEDYQFAAQSTVTPTTTETPEGTLTGSPTVTGSVTAVATATGTVTVAPTETEDTEVASGDDDLFQELSALGSKSEGGAAGVVGAGSGAKINNWLGEAFTKDDGSWQDADADGFSDAMEKDNESDSQNADSTPHEPGNTKLEERISSQDVELETRRLTEESKGDGEEGNVDTDSDGIPDEVEKQRGMNSSAVDSDSDGLRDDRELVLGTNPLRPDSDGDGISDNREYMLGLDPTISEGKRSTN